MTTFNYNLQIIVEDLTDFGNLKNLNSASDKN